MTDKPILFSGPMVRAVLEGRKTQTRRALKDVPEGDWFVDPNPRGAGLAWVAPEGGISMPIRLPYAPGDRLWVLETCATWEGICRDVVYRADESDANWARLKHDAAHGAPWKLRNARYMPRWASRLTLTVTDVRVQRLQDISSFDCLKEGINADDTILREISAADSDKHRRDEYHRAHVEPFRALWDSLNAKRGYGWEANPWVSAITFTVHRCNIDQME